MYMNLVHHIAIIISLKKASHSSRVISKFAFGFGEEIEFLFLLHSFFMPTLNLKFLSGRVNFH